MPVVDLIVRAVNTDPNLPYSQRRLRYRAGEVVDVRIEAGQGAIEGYGVVPLISRRWRIIRVTDALAGDVGTLLGQGAVTPEDIGLGTLPQRRVWLLRIKDVPNQIKNQLVPRKYPDIDHNFFTSRPAVRNALLAKWPALADVPANQRRSTPWDISVTRAQISPYFFRKPDEGRDLDGYPTEPVVADQQIDVGDSL